jgi:cyanophycin synthetase
VPEKQITVIADEQRSVDAALRMARAGDLLLIFGDSIARTWKQIIHFQPAGSGRTPQAPAAAGVKMDVVTPAPGAELPDAEHLIRDARGVRLAREADD